jgi:hypothetical protein
MSVVGHQVGAIEAIHTRTITDELLENALIYKSNFTDELKNLPLPPGSTASYKLHLLTFIYALLPISIRILKNSFLFYL